MFISNYDKEEMRISIRTLQAQMVHVMDELKALKSAKKKITISTVDAPWGFKKDGTPKKRPGRATQPKPEVTNEQPLPV